MGNLQSVKNALEFIGVEAFIDAVEENAPGSRESVTNYLSFCKDISEVLGYIGELKTMHVGIPGNNRSCPEWKPEPVPEGFDYNFWLGPAPYKEYHSNLVHYQFRWQYDYSGGVMTDCWGNAITFNNRDVRAHNGLVATNGLIHDRIVQVVSTVCEEFGFNEDDGFW